MAAIDAPADARDVDPLVDGGELRRADAEAPTDDRLLQQIEYGARGKARTLAARSNMDRQNILPIDLLLPMFVLAAAWPGQRQDFADHS